MDSVTFLNLVRGNRLSNIVGLKMNEGVPYRYASDYTYVEIPLAHMYNPSTEEIQDKALRNQRIKLIPACQLNIRGSGYKVIVKANPKLQEFASAPAVQILDSQQDEQPTVYASFHRDMEASELDWAVRLYLVG